MAKHDAASARKALEESIERLRDTVAALAEQEAVLLAL